jgi:hypothetical protein
MTYQSNNVIAANDYNTFATLSGGLNEMYGDMHSGQTTIANSADYGWGQTSLTSVSAGTPVTATSWANLFTDMRNAGTHTGTTVSPPVPASGPTAGTVVAALNTPTTMSAVISTLRANRLLLGVSQTTSNNYTSSGTSAPWTHTLVYTFTVNLGTWDHARYFFNSGGWIGISGSYPGSGQPTNTDDYEWYTFLNQLGTIQMTAHNTTASLANSISSFGFWDASGNPLTTTYQSIYNRVYGGGGTYTNSSILLEASLGATAPAAGSGTINFRITLTQTDSGTSFQAKTLSTTFTMTEAHSSGVVSWPGTATVTPGSFTLT